MVSSMDIPSYSPVRCNHCMRAVGYDQLIILLFFDRTCYQTWAALSHCERS